jgi:hypothetical protein
MAKARIVITIDTETGHSDAKIYGDGARIPDIVYGGVMAILFSANEVAEDGGVIAVNIESAYQAVDETAKIILGDADKTEKIDADMQKIIDKYRSDKNS